ncbi:MAG TPA: sigma factor, partial [Planctomycetota bacterium]|nr:sigma factor [Planctomycetota bacterium]
DARAVDAVVAEVLVKAADALPVLDWPRRLETWLFQITRNRILDAFRRGEAPVLGEIDESGDGANAESSCADPSGFLHSLRPLVESMPPPEKDILLLVDYEGATDRFLARRLGLESSEIPARVSGARSRLRAVVLSHLERDLDRRSASQS